MKERKYKMDMLDIYNMHCYSENYFYYSFDYDIYIYRLNKLKYHLHKIINKDNSKLLCYIQGL